MEYKQVNLIDRQSVARQNIEDLFRDFRIIRLIMPNDSNLPSFPNRTMPEFFSMGLLSGICLLITSVAQNITFLTVSSFVIGETPPLKSAVLLMNCFLCRGTFEGLIIRLIMIVIGHM